VWIPLGGIDDKEMWALSPPRLVPHRYGPGPCRNRARVAARGTACVKLETAFERHPFGLVPRGLVCPNEGEAQVADADFVENDLVKRPSLNP